MAIHTHGKSLVGKFSRVDQSEKIFNRCILGAVDAGYLTHGDADKKVDVTDKQLDFIKDISYVRDGVIHTRSGASGVKTRRTMAYLDGASTVARTPFYLTSKIARSPMRELNEASSRQRKAALTVDVALRIAQYKGYSNVVAYMATFTIPNCDFDHLEEGYHDVSTGASKIVKALKDGTRNRNGFRLYNQLGKPLNFLGGLISLERTVNAEKLESCSTDGLYHPHAHIMLIFNGHLQDGSDSRLFKYWRNLLPNMTLSPKAFNLEEAYDHRTGRMDVSAAINELQAYATKPDFWLGFDGLLSSDNDVKRDWVYRVFAELFHTIKGKITKRPIGIMRQAQSFVKWLEKGYSVKRNGRHVKYSVLPAVLAASSLNDHAPDILTKRVEFYRDRKGAHFTKPQPLSDLELVYANSALLEQCQWELPDVDWPDNDKARLYKNLLESFQYIEPGYKGLDLMLSSWHTLRLNAAQGKLNYIHVLQDRISRCHDRVLLSELNCKLKKATRDFHSCCLKIKDVLALCDARLNVISNCNRVSLPDYTVKYRRLSLYTALDELAVKFNGNSPIFDSDHKKSRQIEKHLCNAYLNTSDGEHFSFIPPEVLRDYRSYNLGGDSFVYDHHSVLWGDHRDLNLVNQMTPDLFKQWIDDSLTPKPKATHKMSRRAVWLSMFDAPSSDHDRVAVNN